MARLVRQSRQRPIPAKTAPGSGSHPGRVFAAHQLPEARVLLRLEGQDGTGAVLSDLASLSFVVRGKDSALLDRAEVQARLHLPPDQQFARPESDLCRTLYDCPDLAVGPKGERCRVVVATHPASEKKSRVGVQRDGIVYELFLTSLPQSAFTAADVVALYRLSWAERLARNARAPPARRPTITLFGVPDAFASWLGLAQA